MDTHFDRVLTRRIRERDELLAYPLERLSDIIQDVGFSCSLCGRCCTRVFNGYITLLDGDCRSVLPHDRSALEPAPFFEAADQNGVLYTSGFTIKSQNDSEMSCRFLQDGRCQIYHDRPGICRIYPYMLHKERGIDGLTDWRQISGLDLHGHYDEVITRETAETIARTTRDFEEALLNHEIAFLQALIRHFARSSLRPVLKLRDEQQRRMERGGIVTVMVFSEGGFQHWEVSGGHPPLARFIA